MSCVRASSAGGGDSDCLNAVLLTAGCWSYMLLGETSRAVTMLAVVGEVPRTVMGTVEM